MTSLVAEFAEKKPSFFIKSENGLAKTALNQYRELIKFTPDLISNSKPNMAAKAVAKKQPVAIDGKPIAITPRSLEENYDLAQVISQRESSRAYGASALSLETISVLLESACGLRNQDGKRKYPSGGSLYPIDIYLSLNSSLIQGEQLQGGSYRFDAESSKLYLIDERSVFSMPEFNHIFVPNAAGLIILAFDLERMRPKYGAFGYKLSLLEAGHIAQNLLLVMESLSLTGIPLQFYYEDVLNQLLSLTSQETSVCYAVEFGTKPISEKE